MSKQLSLFGDASVGPYHVPASAPYQRHSETSKAAAESVMESGSAETRRNMVMRFIREQGPHGATDDEIMLALEVNTAGSLRPRRIELVNARLVVDSGRKRMTSSKHLATVWVCAEFHHG